MIFIRNMALWHWTESRSDVLWSKQLPTTLKVLKRRRNRSLRQSLMAFNISKGKCKVSHEGPCLQPTLHITIPFQPLSLNFYFTQFSASTSSNTQYNFVSSSNLTMKSKDFLTYLEAQLSKDFPCPIRLIPLRKSTQRSTQQQQQNSSYHTSLK